MFFGPTQRSSFLATLGWMIQSLRDSGERLAARRRQYSKARRLRYEEGVRWKARAACEKRLTNIEDEEEDEEEEE
jgi:hypothetical protein